MVQQPPGAAQQGDQEEDERGRNLPYRGIGDKASRSGALGAARRVAGLERYFSAGSLAKLERTEEVTEQPQLIAG
jgi:hypothetical protein